MRQAERGRVCYIPCLGPGFLVNSHPNLTSDWIGGSLVSSCFPAHTQMANYTQNISVKADPADPGLWIGQSSCSYLVQQAPGEGKQFNNSFIHFRRTKWFAVLYQFSINFYWCVLSGRRWRSCMINKNKLGLWFNLMQPHSLTTHQALCESTLRYYTVYKCSVVSTQELHLWRIY